MRRKKIAVTLIAGLLLMFLYGTIFSFSAQNGETSTNISRESSSFLVKILDTLSIGRISQEMLEQMADRIEHPLRKTAHFLEYACMGVLVYTLLFYPVGRPRKRYLLTVSWVFVSAVLDEWHQYFVPGRWCSFSDVLLDTCGGITGAVLCVLTVKLYKQTKSKR